VTQNVDFTEGCILILCLWCRGWWRAK